MLAGFAPCNKPDGSLGVIGWPGSDYRSDRVRLAADAVAIAGPRRAKSVARLFLGLQSLPSHYGLTPPFPGTLAGYFLTRPEP